MSHWSQYYWDGNCKGRPGSMVGCDGAKGEDGYCLRHRPIADPGERLRKTLDPLGDYVKKEKEKARKASRQCAI